MFSVSHSPDLCKVCLLDFLNKWLSSYVMPNRRHEGEPTKCKDKTVIITPWFFNLLTWENIFILLKYPCLAYPSESAVSYSQPVWLGHLLLALSVKRQCFPVNREMSFPDLFLSAECLPQFITQSLILRKYVFLIHREVVSHIKMSPIFLQETQSLEHSLSVSSGLLYVFLLRAFWAFTTAFLLSSGLQAAATVATSSLYPLWVLQPCSWYWLQQIFGMPFPLRPASKLLQHHRSYIPQSNSSVKVSGMPSVSLTRLTCRDTVFQKVFRIQRTFKIIQSRHGSNSNAQESEAGISREFKARVVSLKTARAT